MDKRESENMMLVAEMQEIRLGFVEPDKIAAMMRLSLKEVIAVLLEAGYERKNDNQYVRT